MIIFSIFHGFNYYFLAIWFPINSYLVDKESELKNNWVKFFPIYMYIDNSNRLFFYTYCPVLVGKVANHKTRILFV